MRHFSAGSKPARSAGMARPSRQQERAAEELIRIWMNAMRVRRVIEAELRVHDLAFALCWVLHTTHRLIHALDDDHAVSQRAVSQRTELDKSTMSYLMGVLAERGLVDRGQDPFDRSYRIALTRRGQRLLGQSWIVIERLVHDPCADPALPPATIERPADTKCK